MVDRRTSIKRFAMRSVWKRDRPPAVWVLTKNVRGHPMALFGSEGREGFDIAGAKALHTLLSLTARLKSCPDTKLQFGVHHFPNLKIQTWGTRQFQPTMLLSGEKPRSEPDFATVLMRVTTSLLTNLVVVPSKPS